MTAEQIVESALSECEALGHKYWTAARGPLYRRITVRQQELFAMAATWNEDWAGWDAVAQMKNGIADFAALLTDDHPTHPGAERITYVQIIDPGTSTYKVGQEVSIVRHRDADWAELPPRATIRSGILKGYGRDLIGVAQVQLFYTRMPRPMERDEDESELTGGHVDLLILDLARHLLLADPELARTAIEPSLVDIGNREKERLGAFESHVRMFAPTVDRF